MSRFAHPQCSAPLVVCDGACGAVAVAQKRNDITCGDQCDQKSENILRHDIVDFKVVCDSTNNSSTVVSDAQDEVGLTHCTDYLNDRG